MKTSYYGDFSKTSNSATSLASILMSTALIAAPISGAGAAHQLEVAPVQNNGIYRTAFSDRGPASLSSSDDESALKTYTAIRKTVKTKIRIGKIHQRRPASVDTGYLIERV